MIDAPVSGGEPKAIDGTLSIMVVGDKSVFEEVKAILLVIGASAVHCGEIGAGNTTKLVNQVIVALNIAAVSEGFTLAKAAGVDPQLVFDAIKCGLAGKLLYLILTELANRNGEVKVNRSFMLLFGHRGVQ